MTLRCALVCCLLLLSAAAFGCGQTAARRGGSRSDESPTPVTATATTTPAARPAVSRAGDPIKLVVTLSIFADFARAMGGENVEVAVLIPEGENPHAFKPSEEDAKVIADADIVFVNGQGLEDGLVDFINQRRVSRTPLLITFAANVPSPTAEQPQSGLPIYATEAADDPHLWLDPTLAKVYPETVADSLTIVDGANEAYYHTNFGAYRESVEALDREISEKLQGIPARNRQLVTYHNSLVHFASRYGFDVLGLATTDPARGPDADAATALTSLIEREDVPAVFREVGYDASALESAAADADVEVCALYTESFGEGIETYLDMMRFNADELVRCLGD